MVISSLLALSELLNRRCYDEWCKCIHSAAICSYRPTCSYTAVLTEEKKKKKTDARHFSIKTQSPALLSTVQKTVRAHSGPAFANASVGHVTCTVEAPENAGTSALLVSIAMAGGVKSETHCANRPTQSWGLAIPKLHLICTTLCYFNVCRICIGSMEK